MKTFSKDFSGNPIFEIRGADGLTRFVPYEIATIHEYIKAKLELDKEKERRKSGAV